MITITKSGEETFKKSNKTKFMANKTSVVDVLLIIFLLLISLNTKRFRKTVKQEN